MATKEWRTDKTGNKKLLSIIRIPEFNELGELKGIICAAEDITNKEEMERKIRTIIEEYEVIINNTHDLLTLIEVTDDKEFKFKRINPAMEKIMQLPIKEARGKAPKEVFGENAGKKIEERYKKCLSLKEPISYDEEIKFKDEKRVLLTTLSPVIIGGEVIQIVSSSEDITEYKRLEEKLFEANQKLEEEAEKQKKLLEKINMQLDRARDLHKNFLPAVIPGNDKLTIGTYHQEAEQVGGDIYNFIEIDNYIIGYLIDVTGHGMDSSLLNVFARNTIDEYILHHEKERSCPSPRRILKFITKRYKKENFPEDYFICILLFVIDKQKMKVSYSNAGIQILPIINKDGALLQPKNKELPISTAISEEVYDFKEEKVKLENGEAILFTTDGLIEERIGQQRYGEKRVKEVFVDNNILPAEGIVGKIMCNFNQFTGKQFGEDDITLLVIKNEPPVIEQYSRIIYSDYGLIYQVEDKISSVIKNYYSQGDKILMGFRELLVNAIKHGNGEDSKKKVKIEMCITEKYIKIRVEDEGEGFNWRRELNKELCCESLAESGRGVAIANKACDSLYYNKKGNKATLIKLR